jgi:hypothetical protein
MADPTPASFFQSNKNGRVATGWVSGPAATAPVFDRFPGGLRDVRGVEPVGFLSGSGRKEQSSFQSGQDTDRSITVRITEAVDVRDPIFKVFDPTAVKDPKRPVMARDNHRGRGPHLVIVFKGSFR